MLCYAYNVVDNAVNDARHSDASNLPHPLQKLFRQIPSYFAEDILGIPPKPWKFRENMTSSFWEIF